MKYKHIFFDLDRTLWDFEQNMRITLRDIFQKHGLQNYAPDSQHFIDTFLVHNDRLWREYQHGNVRKEVLRYTRFEKTLADYGIRNSHLAEVIAQEYIDESPKKTALIPHSIEVLDYLKERYTMHIITNGFNEVQFRKVELCGLSPYFSKLITSEISGYHKPHPMAFGFALREAGAQMNESIMIGDDLNTDIMGAKEFGIDQIYFNPQGVEHQQQVTHEVSSLEEIMKIL